MNNEVTHAPTITTNAGGGGAAASSSNGGSDILLLPLDVLSVLPFLAVLYLLNRSSNGFSAVMNLTIAISQFFYKRQDEIFLTIDGWHKLLNISMLIEFCALMTYLARIPEERKGYILGLGVMLVIIVEEKDFMSMKYAMIPLTFNNTLLFTYQCLINRGMKYEVNQLMVVKGVFWYVVSIVALLLDLLIQNPSYSYVL